MSLSNVAGLLQSGRSCLAGSARLRPHGWRPRCPGLALRMAVSITAEALRVSRPRASVIPVQGRSQAWLESYLRGFAAMRPRATPSYQRCPSSFHRPRTPCPRSSGGHRSRGIEDDDAWYGTAGRASQRKPTPSCGLMRVIPHSGLAKHARQRASYISSPPTAIVGASRGAGRPSIRRCERVA
jgi:hypothetical protein